MLTVPTAVPVAFGASWIIQARMSAAIVCICGHDLTSDRVKTLVVAALVGDAVKDILKHAGIQVGKGLTRTLIGQIPGKLLIEINKQVGFRLITKAGQTGVINLMKGVPLIGGAIGGSMEAYFCRVVGWQAKALFHRQEASEESPV